MNFEGQKLPFWLRVFRVVLGGDFLLFGAMATLRWKFGSCLYVKFFKELFGKRFLQSAKEE
jgi:hypothetical protein